MAKVRRSLSAALNVSPEALAFIEGAKPNSVIVSKAEKVPNDSQDEIESAEEVDATSKAVAAVNQEARSRRRHRSNRSEPLEPQLPPGMAGLLVPLTTRISPRVATSLKRAGLEQRLHGRRPGTVQEIVEKALEKWLMDFEYLDPSRPT